MGVHMTESQNDKPKAGPAHGQWAQQSAGLYMCADATGAGRLVRLADVALWLIESEGLPRIPAVHHLADELEAARFEPALFLAQSGQYARPFEGDAAQPVYRAADSWAAQGGSRQAGRRVISSGIASDSERRDCRTPAAPPKPPEFVGPPIPGSLRLPRLLRQCWTFAHWGWKTDAEIFAAPQLPGFDVAVSVADAARIWEWGQALELVPAAVPVFPLKDWPALVAYRRANPGTSWALGNQIEIGRAEFERRGGNKPGCKRATLDAMAHELELSAAQPLERALWRERQRKKRPSMANLPATRHRLAG